MHDCFCRFSGAFFRPHDASLVWEPDLSFNNSRQESDGSSGSRDAVAVQVIVCAFPRTSTAAEAESRKREDEGEREMTDSFVASCE